MLQYLATLALGGVAQGTGRVLVNIMTFDFDDMIFVSLMSWANGELKLHTVKALHPLFILKSIIIVITAICIIFTSHPLS